MEKMKMTRVAIEKPVTIESAGEALSAGGDRREIYIPRTALNGKSEEKPSDGGQETESGPIKPMKYL